MPRLDEQLADDLRRHEGFRAHVYDDATGLPIVPGSYVHGTPTIGYGTALHHMSRAEAEVLLLMRVQLAIADARELYGDVWSELDQVRRRVLANMAYNLGRFGLSGFRLMAAAIRRSDYEEAARQLLSSRYARQVGRRASELADQLKRGDAPDSWRMV